MITDYPAVPLAKDHVRAIQPYRPGPADDWPPESGARLSLNESALGPSPRAIAAYAEAGRQLGRYGDSMGTAMKAAIAARHGFAADWLCLGNGSEELLLLLARGFLGPGDEALFTEYGFLVYRIAIQSAGATPIAVAEKAFTADVDALLGAVTPRTKMVFLANPNNPTGTALPAHAVARLHAGLPSDVLLVLDGAYTELLAGPDYSDGRELVRSNANVVLLRTFSKAYGLAGARLGFAYGPPNIMEVLDKLRAPFNVASAAMAAGMAALADQSHLDRVIAHTQHHRAKLADGLSGYGLSPVPSHGNFLLVQLPPGLASPAVQDLHRHGLLVRSLAGYGLPDAVRITVGTEAENAAVVAGLADVLAKPGKQAPGP